MTDTQTSSPDVDSQVADTQVAEVGSPDEGARADGEGEGLKSEGDEPSQKDDGAAPQASQDASEMESLREEIADLRATTSQQDAILSELDDQMERNPALRKMLARRGSGADSSENDLISTLDEVLDENFNPDAAAAMRKLILPLMKENASMKRDLGETRSRMARMSRTVGGTEFRESLAKHGVAPAIQGSKAFKNHVKRLRTTPDFQNLESRSSNFAAEMAAATWVAGQARASGWRDDQTRIATAKAGQGGNVPSRGSSKLERTVEIKREPGDGHLDKAAAIRFKAADAGQEPPKIVYV